MPPKSRCATTVDQAVNPQRRGGAGGRVAPDARGCGLRLPRPRERTIDVPLSETTGNRGGIHNSLTRLLIKPSHLAVVMRRTPSRSTISARPVTNATR